MTTLRTITTSEITTWQRCQEEHRIAYVLGYRPVRREAPLALGTVVHAGLEAWWGTSSLDHAIDAVRGFATTEGLDAYETVRAEVMLTGYDARWSDRASEYAVVSLEETFGLLRGPYRFGGKFDGRAIRSGRKLVVEHKTSSADITPGSEYWARLTIDSQVGNYLEAAAGMGWEADGVLYDVLRTPGLEPLRATPESKRKYRKDGALYANQREHDETVDEFRARLIEEIAAAPESYYQRQTIVRLEHERDRARRDTHAVALAILAADRDEMPRSPGACKRYGRLCAYFDVCTGAASLEDSRFRRAATPHEELAP